MLVSADKGEETRKPTIFWEVKLPPIVYLVRSQFPFLF